MSRPYKCPGCSSIKTIWKGHRRRRDGKVRLRKCNACGKRFTSRVVIASNTRKRKDQGGEA